MENIELLAGASFDKVAYDNYHDVLKKRKKSVTFRFNGVQVIMFNDLED